jgi:hypothetical protein
MYKRFCDFDNDSLPTENDCVVMYSVTSGHNNKITIGQLLGLQQQALNKPCDFCGSRGKFDVRGNCGACGAPVMKTLGRA